MGIEERRGQRETYYGKYSGTITKLGLEEQVSMSSSFNIGQNLAQGAGQAVSGHPVQGTKTAMGLQQQPKKDTGTKHKLIVEVTADKIVAKLDGKELSDCGYKVGVEGGGAARLLANDMDVSLTIAELTPDGKNAQKFFASLNDPGDAGELIRIKS